MREGPNRPSEDYRSNTVGFGRLAYDPISKTWWYYGFGKALDQGGCYPAPTNFGSGGLETFLRLLKDSLEFAQPEIERLTQEKVNEGNDKRPV